MLLLLLLLVVVVVLVLVLRSVGGSPAFTQSCCCVCACARGVRARRLRQAGAHSRPSHIHCSKYGLSSNTMALITSVCSPQPGTRRGSR